MRRVLPIAATILLLTSACSDGSDPSTTYRGSDSELDTAEDAAEAPDDSSTPPDASAEDFKIPLTCIHGESICIGNKKAICDAKFGWLVESCPDGTSCEEGECVAAECAPLEARCLENAVQICSPDGSGWSAPMDCPEGKLCREGTCMEPDCEPMEKVCIDNKVLTCGTDGTNWLATPCEDGEVCFEGQCIECIKHEDCPEGLACVEGICDLAPLAILTSALPDGVVGQPYAAQLKGEGGLEPYDWNIIGGNLPQGLELAGDGALSGTPEEAGDFAVTIELADDAGDTVETEFAFSVFGAGTDLVITTGSPLPSGEEGEPYETQLEAAGGMPPYFWGIVDGALPAGLTLTSAGAIEGVPADHGTFDFTVKVFDNGNPVGLGSKEFKLTITVAPLVILGDQEYDLFITKIIVLPLITTMELIPIPYNQQLKAKGGVKPYDWAEIPLPGFVDYLIPNSGLPEGLDLDSDGKLHGSTQDVDAVVSVKIPFTQIDLSGYFFAAEVKDSQSPADSDWAIYLIPTVPVAF